MIIKQLSIFLENKSGRLTEVSEILGQSGINMTAFSIADTSDFGILRVVVSDPNKARDILKEKGFMVSLTDVLCLLVPNEPGGLAKALTILNKEKVNIEYMYAFANEDKAQVIIKAEDINHCLEIIKQHKLDLISSSELYSW